MKGNVVAGERANFAEAKKSMKLYQHVPDRAPDCEKS